MSEEYFGLNTEKVSELVDDYLYKRNFDEDLIRLNSFGGIDSIVKSLKTNLENGIDINNTKDIELRKEIFGENTIERPEQTSFCDLVLEAFGDTFIQILIVAAFIQISIGLSPLAQSSTDWIDGIAICSAILIVVITSSVTNYNKELNFRSLNQINDSMFQIAAIRGGHSCIISSEDLLVGDIFKLEIGMIVPVDGILISGESISVNEASITGESHPVYKESHAKCLSKKVQFKKEKSQHSLPSPVLISSTTIETGSGWLLALAVGKNSIKGKVSNIVILSKGDSSDKTPLEIKLEDIAEDIGKFGLYAAILTFLALCFKLLWSKYTEFIFHTERNISSGNSGMRMLTNTTEIIDAMTNIISNSTNNSIATSSNGSNETNNQNSSQVIVEPKSESQSIFYDPNSVFVGIHKEILTILMLCVAIIVVAIPEGLPLAVTLALSFSVGEMMKENNLVRHISACETMGGANFILTDKTGTLTQNKMSVTYFYNNKNNIDLSKINPIKENQSIIIQNPNSFFSERYYQIIKESVLSNTEVHIDTIDGKEKGSQTDLALYHLIENFGEDCIQYLREFEVKERLPFDSNRKRMSTLLGFRKSNITNISGELDVQIVHTKGAPEYILSCCDSYIDPINGEKKNMDRQTLKEINDICESYQTKALRCLALAYKEIKKGDLSKFKDTSNEKNSTEYVVEQDKFSLIGVFAVGDKLKNQVPEAIITCKKAGISVVMVTGDNKITANAYARDCNILTGQPTNENSMTGDQFYSIIGGVICDTCKLSYDYCRCKSGKEIDESEEIKVNIKKLKIANISAFSQLASNLKVLARARPIDKFAFVLGLKELGHVVAVTGDGSNDAQALAKADVGFAMGKQGTEAAKNASDIIVLDDNFASIVNSIKWGRNIFDNIRKFLQFQLSVNVSAVLLVFVTSCIGSESPISAIQMLWLNLIMDSLGSLALATEAPTKDLLNRSPYSKREYLISGIMWKNIVSQSCVQFSVIFFLYIWAEKFVIEEHPERIKIYTQFENCFGDFSAAIVRYQKHSLLHYIVDGKKSSWNPLHLIKPDLSQEYCMFYNREKFRPNQIINLEDAYKWYVTENGNTTHMTIVFNCFVLYSLFNQLNSRILDDSLNIFKNIFSNWFFILIVIAEISIQVLLVEYGGIIFKCSVGGLTQFQWGICVSFASITFFVAFIVKLLPFEKCNKGSKLTGSRDIELRYKENLIDNENRKDDLEKALEENAS